MLEPELVPFMIWFAGCPICIAVCLCESYLRKNTVSKREFMGLLVLSLLPLINLAVTLVSMSGIIEYHFEPGFWERPMFDFSKRENKK